MPRSTTRAFSLVALGVTLFLAGLAGQYAQDASAPWWNIGEARMRSALVFDADGGRYRVITSGASRPALERVGCTIRTADGGSLRRLGGSGAVNPREALGVSRVLEFRAPAGPTAMVCADRISRTSTYGRYQVVAADGPLSKAITAALVLGVASVLLGGLLLWRGHRRSGGDDDRPRFTGAGWSAFGDRGEGPGGGADGGRADGGTRAAAGGPPPPD